MRKAILLVSLVLLLSGCVQGGDEAGPEPSGQPSGKFCSSSNYSTAYSEFVSSQYATEYKEFEDEFEGKNYIALDSESRDKFISASKNITRIGPAFQEIGELTCLEMFIMPEWGHHLRDMSPLKNLKNLKVLKIFYNGNDLSPLAELTELEYLHLRSSTDSIDISPLGKLSKLKYLKLDLSDRAKPDLSSLSGLINLRVLILRSGELTDLSPLPKLKNLEALGLEFNFSIEFSWEPEGSDISKVGEMTNLKLLHITGLSWPVTDPSPLRKLTNLEELILTMSVKTEDLSFVSGMKNLQKFIFKPGGVAISDGELPSDISSLSSLTKMEVLTLPDTKVSDISALSNMADLKVLDLWNANISDISPLRGLTNLEELNLRETNISDISALTGLTKLRELNLSGTNVSDISPLSNMTNLKIVNLASTKVSDISVLSEMKGLQTVDLSKILGKGYPPVSEEDCKELRNALPDADYVICPK